MVSSVYSGFSDAELLARIATDDAIAFNELYHRHHNALIGYLYNRLRDRDRALELVQDAFLSIWNNRKRATINSPREYLFGTARFLLLHHIRDTKMFDSYREKFHTEYSPAEFVDNSNEQHQRVNDIENSIERALQELPLKQRKVFQLSRENLTTEEIATRMNLTQRGVENYMSLIRKHLRASLGEFLVLVWWVSRVW